MKITRKKCNNELVVPKSHRNAVISDTIKPPCVNADHTAIICGTCNSGKSVVTQSWLKKTGQYRRVFDNVFYICPPASRGAFRHCVFKHADESKVYDELTCEALNEIAQRVDEANEEAASDAAKDQLHSLVVVDDCQSAMKDGDIAKCLLPIMSSYRHRQLSVWLVCQSWHCVPRPIRNVARVVVQFKMGSKREIEAYHEEVLPMLDTQQTKQLMRYVWKDKSDKHSHLMVDRATGRMSKNMDLLCIEMEDENENAD